jgi:hypothetical protein
MSKHDDYDPVEEVRRSRDRISARFGDDVQAYGEHLMEYQEQFADRLVPPPGRKKVDRPAA